MQKNLKPLEDNIAIGYKPKKAVTKKLESHVQREICDWLFLHEFFFWRQNTIPVFEHGHFRALPKYTPRGLPDIMVLHGGRFIGLEVKNVRKGHPGYTNLSEYQKDMREKILLNGGAYHMVTSLAEVKEIFDESYPSGAIII